MKIEAYLTDSDRTVHIKYYGVKEDDSYVKMSYKILATYPWEEEEVVDETKPVGFREETASPYTGYKVVAYQEIYDGNNKLIKTNEINSTYKSRNHIITVGPAEPELPPWDEDPDDIYDPWNPGWNNDDPDDSYNPGNPWAGSGGGLFG